jgi:lipoprotein-releasing system permease protein
MAKTLSPSAPPFGLFERILAGRYLRARRQHGGVALISIISFVGIMLAVAVLIITMSIMNGFRETLLSRIVGVNGHIYVDMRGQPPEIRDALAIRIREVAGVTQVIPVIEGQALAMTGQPGAPSVVRGAVVRGLPAGELRTMPIVADSIVSGDLARFGPLEEEGSAGIAIGSGLASALYAAGGSMITLVSPEGAPTPFGMAPRRKSYEAAAVFNVGMSEYDAVFIYMPLEEAQRFFGRGDGVDRLEVRIQNPDQTKPVLDAMRQFVPPDISFWDWKTENSSMVGALQVERTVMRMILMMLVAIAALNIISGLVMLVKNKGRDIAILRTMGASKGSILRIFFMAGASVGVLGALTGIALGVLFCLNITPIQNFVEMVTGQRVFDPAVYSLSRIPQRIEAGEVLTVGAWAIFMSLLATLPPAWRASRLDPVEALRYE